METNRTCCRINFFITNFHPFAHRYHFLQPTKHKRSDFPPFSSSFPFSLHLSADIIFSSCAPIGYLDGGKLHENMGVFYPYPRNILPSTNTKIKSLSSVIFPHLNGTRRKQREQAAIIYHKITKFYTKKKKKKPKPKTF